MKKAFFILLQRVSNQFCNNIHVDTLCCCGSLVIQVQSLMRLCNFPRLKGLTCFYNFLWCFTRYAFFHCFSQVLRVLFEKMMSFHPFSSWLLLLGNQYRHKSEDLQLVIVIKILPLSRLFYETSNYITGQIVLELYNICSGTLQYFSTDPINHK